MENKENTRRSFIKTTAAAITLTAIGGNVLAKSLSGETTKMQTTSPIPFTLPTLPYAYDALEPYIDKQTMEIHHTKHHQAYVNNLNKALEGKTTSNEGLTMLCKTIDDKTPAAVRNNAGGHYNHSLFWTLMAANGKPLAKGSLNDAIATSFGSITTFKEQFSAAAMSRFGSGWAWLTSNNGKLEIVNTPNQDNPLMPVSGLKGTPILALDVWEHAYYLKYQNRRAEYVAAWWNVVNWEKAADLYKNA